MPFPAKQWHQQGRSASRVEGRVADWTPRRNPWPHNRRSTLPHRRPEFSEWHHHILEYQAARDRHRRDVGLSGTVRYHKAYFSIPLARKAFCHPSIIFGDAVIFQHPLSQLPLQKNLELKRSKIMQSERRISESCYSYDLNIQRIADTDILDIA